MRNPLNHPHAQTIFLAHVCALVIVLVVGIALGLGVPYVPRLDAKLRPAIKFGYTDHKTGRYEAPVQALYRDPVKACWTLYLEKLRYADIGDWDFYMDGKTSAPIPTYSYVVFDDGVADPNPMKPHDPGVQWHRRWCFDVAGRVPNFKSMTIFGTARHSAWPHLWDTIEPTPVFTMGPLSKLSP